MSNKEKVAAIREAWRQLMPDQPPIVYMEGPQVDLDLYAQVAVNVLTDWDKVPEFCPGLNDPRCKGICTVDIRDNRIKDPDCFRSA